MSDSSEIGPFGTVDRVTSSRAGSGEQSPLRIRASFLKNRGWDSVISLNRQACERGRAQHGFNSETQATTALEWAEKENSLLCLAEVLEFLRYCQHRAPFLFYNASTFADIGRQIAGIVFAELPNTRRRKVSSALAHYIEGILDHEFMAQIVDELCASAGFQPGDRVKTLRGSTCGTIIHLQPDGRVVWRADSGLELMSLPEALLQEKKK